MAGSTGLGALAALASYALIGWLSRTAEVSEYYVAGRSVPPFYNGMATGADWMSAASFIGMAGSLYFGGYDGLAFVLGWTGGYVLVSILMAPYLRKFGQFTVPDFCGARYGGNAARSLAVIVLEPKRWFVTPGAIRIAAPTSRDACSTRSPAC